MSDFKIGDRVRAKHEPERVGEVLGVLYPPYLGVVFDDANSRCCWAPASWFERVPEIVEEASLQYSVVFSGDDLWALSHLHVAFSEKYGGEYQRIVAGFLERMKESWRLAGAAPPSAKPEVR